MAEINKDNYREPISDVDLGANNFDFLSEETEEALPLEETKEEKPVDVSIKESIIKEEALPKEEILPSKEEETVTPDLSAFPHIEIEEQEEVEEEPIKEEKPVDVSIKESIIKEEALPVEDVNPLKRKIEIKEASVEEEAPIEIEESYKEIRDAFWDKINPANVNRFKDLCLEENEENRNKLNDLSVKVTFLDDDLEDGMISEEEAISRIKEIQSKI
ncbi:MAG: hypothetical protein PHF88_02195 [Candidatus Pacebacteria bacterium]|nr:hypothetical protein [Candidatus Paceibacterota bacterium]